MVFKIFQHISQLRSAFVSLFSTNSCFVEKCLDNLNVGCYLNNFLLAFEFENDQDLDLSLLGFDSVCVVLSIRDEEVCVCYGQIR